MLASLAFTEIGTSSAGAFSIAAGPDGNLWFPEGSDEIGAINATTHALMEFPGLHSASGVRDHRRTRQ